ncbi:transcriptional regulator TrmB [Streptomyces albus subsp. albus]|nr:transcriptional regulator TrmB [Streptomyces albus subsp. albus]
MTPPGLRAELRRLGLSEQEALAYTALLDGGPMEYATLAAALGCTPEEAGRTAQRLIRLGLAGSSGASGVAPVDPSLALRHLVHERTAEVRRAETAAADAYETYRRTVHPQPTDDLVEVVTGPQIVERILQIESAAEAEVLRFDSPPYHTVPGPNELEIGNLAAGVRYRVVYSTSAVQDAYYHESNIQPCIAAGEEARVLPAVPVKLTVFDRRLAIVSMSFVEAERNDSLLLVRPSSLLTALTGLFETSWRSAFPMHGQDARMPPALPPVQRRVLELLGTGVTDDTMAQLLGISRRTLSRHVEQLTHRAGATNRFQLALYAARRGWL